jgi:hypothetical protein
MLRSLRRLGKDGFTRKTRVAAGLYQGLGSGFEGFGRLERLGLPTPRTSTWVTLTKYVGNWVL